MLFKNLGFEMGWWRKKKPKSDIASERWAKQILERGTMLLEDLIECCDGKSNPIKFFSADEILKATDNFSKSNRVSELSYSRYKWYSGKNENHHKILITKDLPFNRYGEGIFWRDIAVSSMVSGHKNFLKLVGCCIEFEYPVLVYHGVKKHYNLDLRKEPWKRRMKIAEDIAIALAYLHTAFPRPFVHTSMSLGKILLDDDGDAKLKDFSYCVSIPKGETFVQVYRFGGTYKYMDPKYMMSGVVSEKTDVFAIGISLQQLLMGQERHRVVQHDSATMSEKNDWLFKFLEERRMDEIADPEMLEKMGEISEQELCQMKAFLMLSLRCVGHKGEVPTMVEVAKELKKIQRSRNHDSSSPSAIEKSSTSNRRTISKTKCTRGNRLGEPRKKSQRTSMEPSGQGSLRTGALKRQAKFHNETQKFGDSGAQSFDSREDEMPAKAGDVIPDHLELIVDTHTNPKKRRDSGQEDSSGYRECQQEEDGAAY